MTRCWLRLAPILTLTLSLIGGSDAYKDGAPENACISMTPGHNVPPSSSAAPYSITPSEVAIAPGQSLSVFVAGSSPFRGFLMRVRQMGSFISGGHFSVAQGTQLRCGGEGITHADVGSWNTLNVTWTAPDDLDLSGPLQFVTTIVRDYENFWTMVQAAEIWALAGPTTRSTSQTASTSTTEGSSSQSSTQSTFQTSNATSSTVADDSAITTPDDGGAASITGWKHPGVVQVPPGCGTDIGCFHNCDTGICSFAVTWKPQGQSVRLRLMYRTTSGTDQWIAIGLSKDRLMGDDSVMECVMDRDQVLVKTSYNNGKFNDYPDDKRAALKDYHGSVVNGVLACEMTRLLSYPREPKVFDLHHAYFLFIAYGEAVGGNKFPHSYEKLPIVSTEKISLRVVGRAEEGLGALYPMVKTHGTAMVVAWMLFANIGVFIARNGRTMLSSSRPCGKDVWFHIHRFCMTMTLFLTITGFCLILIESQGRSHIPEVPGKSYVTLHPPLGLIVIILTIVNPLMAAFRPELTSPSRPLFRWTHWGFGVFAWFVSFIVLIIGLNLDKAHAEKEAVYIVFAFIGYSIIMEVLVRVIPYTCGAMRACCNSDLCSGSNSYDFNADDFRHAEVATVERSDKESANEELAQITKTENVVRSTVLILHIIACTCFTVGVLYFSLRKSVHHVITHGD